MTATTNKAERLRRRRPELTPDLAYWVVVGLLFVGSAIFAADVERQKDSLGLIKATDAVTDRVIDATGEALGQFGQGEDERGDKPQ